MRGHRRPFTAPRAAGAKATDDEKGRTSPPAPSQRPPLRQLRFNTQEREPIYPPPRAKSCDEANQDRAKERLDRIQYTETRTPKRERGDDDEEEGMAIDGGEEETARAGSDDDLPPSLKRAKREQEKKAELERIEAEEGVIRTRAQVKAAKEAAESSSSSESSSEAEVDEHGNPLPKRKKRPRLPVSELGRLYFEGKVQDHTGSRHEGVGIVVVDVRANAAQMFDRTGKQFGNRKDPGYDLKRGQAEGVQMGDEVRIAGKVVLLGPAVDEHEYLSGAFFLRKNTRRRKMEKQRRKVEEERLREIARGKRNHLAHTGATALTFGTSMISKSAEMGKMFRPIRFRRYKKPGSSSFHIPLKGATKKKEEEKKHVPWIHNPDEEGAVVLFRAEYKYDSAHRPLMSVVVDPVLGQKLRPHQKIGVQFLWDCVTGKRVPGYYGCILADDMGLGKSIQAITLLWTCLKQGIHGEPVAKKAVVVAPSSLVQNWCNELTKWLGEGTVNPCSISQSTPRGERILNTFEGDATRNVLVISYDQLRKYEARFKKMTCVGLVVCDEGHRLKNAEIKTTKAVDCIPTPRRVILSGTPLQNDLGEFHAMVNFCNPGVVGSLNTFRTVFEGPIMAGREPLCPENEKLLGEARAYYLATLTNKFILRRTSTINEKYLPAKIEQTVFVRCTDLQVKLYNFIVSIRDKLSNVDGEGGGERTSPALMAITALKKLCNHPDLIHQIATKSPKAFPGILKVYPKGYSVLSCENGLSGKADFVDSLLQQLLAMPQRTRDKVVIVSNYTQTLDVLAALCKHRGAGYFQLDGNTPIKKRQQLVDKFNIAGSPEVVFLLSSKAGGVGLNLIGANRLVLYDPDWNPANDAQAMGRVWRDGQRKKVYIYRLLGTGTIEEKIYQRQVSKQGLSANVMDATDTSKQHFTTSELKALFVLKPDTNCETHDLLMCKCCAPKEKQEDKLRAPFKVATRTGPRMDELKSWQHLPNASAGNDAVLSRMDPKGKLVSFIFANERDKEKVTGPDIQEEKNFEKDEATIVCKEDAADDDDDDDEVSIESDDEEGEEEEDEDDASSSS